MKGFVLLALTISVLLVLLPFLAVSHTAPPVSEQPDAAFTVKVSSGDASETIADYDLVLYAVMGKLPYDAHTEAIKAAAVAEYSRFCYQQETGDGTVTTDTDFPDTFREAYWREAWGENYEQASERFAEAVKEVLHEIIVYNGHPIMALTHSLNAGQTESYAVLWEEEIPYLQAVISEQDAACDELITTVSVSQTEAAALLETLIGQPLSADPKAWFSEPVTVPSGLVKEITVDKKTVSGVAVREAFSLPSAAFNVAVQEGKVIFTVKGRGHFVGMSLYGARCMADSGVNYKEILTHYYPHTTFA